MRGFLIDKNVKCFVVRNFFLACTPTRDTLANQNTSMIHMSKQNIMSLHFNHLGFNGKEKKLWNWMKNKDLRPRTCTMLMENTSRKRQANTHTHRTVYGNGSGSSICNSKHNSIYIFRSIEIYLQMICADVYFHSFPSSSCSWCAQFFNAFIFSQRKCCINWLLLLFQAQTYPVRHETIK